jgi:perosamine synthetase
VNPGRVPFFRPLVDHQEIDGVGDVLRSGWLTTGPVAARFEEAIRSLTGAGHAVALSSCTAALHLALAALPLRRGELVLMPTLTFAAGAEVISHLGATPVFVDSDASRSMDPDALRSTLEAIAGNRPVAGLTPPYGRPAAVVPVHFGGRLASIEALLGIAGEFGLALVEDVAHAFGAARRSPSHPDGLAAGRWGTAGCYSFYANKCITTGEGGMLLTDDPDLADRVRTLSQHGMDRSAWARRATRSPVGYEISSPGFKYNMADTAAAIGLAQLDRAESMRLDRARVAARYRADLADLPGIRIPPPDPTDEVTSWHLFQIEVDPDVATRGRDELIEALHRRGVDCAVHYRPLHLHAYYATSVGYRQGDFPVAERLGARSISLPIFPGMTDAELGHVITSVREAATSTAVR